MFEQLPNLLAPKFFVLYAFIASAVYVHYRGAVRHRFYRQITDHSTIMAPYNVLMRMFATLPPGGDLGKHRDPFAGSLRYHLGLSTPNSDKCRIWVDGQEYSWRDGEAVMFDETYMHWAENKTDTLRIILFADIERPLKSKIMGTINHWFKNTVIRASETNNAEGDRVGVLNRIFGVAYYLRLPAKALKRKSKTLYYVLKWAILGGLVVWLLA